VNIGLAEDLAMVGDTETALIGGRVTAGVVRIGDRVRRPRSANTPFVHQLLRHLENQGFDACPRLLAENDGHDREVLSYLPGEVPPDLAWFSDDQLATAARLIRRLHDATAESSLAGASEVVCHNDLSPCNFVFVDGLPRAIIDFDDAAPGSRVSDLGYAAWGWLDIGDDAIAAEEQVRRLVLFANAYGWPDLESLVAAMIARQHAQVARVDARGWKDAADWAAQCAAWSKTQLRPALRRYADQSAA
jgi:Ser/Thr protein kinase RdoA (MazF antagonist)